MRTISATGNREGNPTGRAANGVIGCRRSMPPSSEDFTQQHRSRRRKSALRSGAGMLVCPRCGIPMHGNDHDLGIAWRCKACGGQSLNFSQFRRMVPEHGANDIWLQAANRPNAPKHPTECPECQAGMDAVLIPFRGAHVELDICRACQRLWLDRQEHEATPSLALAPPGERQAGPTRREKAELMMRALEHADDLRQERIEKKRSFVGEVFALISGWLTYVLMNDPVDVGIAERNILTACAVSLLCWIGFFLWKRKADGSDE